MLELETAQIIARSPAMYVAQGYHFADPLTGKDREGDVLAEMFVETADKVHAITLVVECKDTRSPWVFFVGTEGATAEPWRALRNTDVYGCIECRALYERLERQGAPVLDAYAVTEKRAKNAKDHAHEAVQQAATALTAQFPEISDGHGTHGRKFPVFGHAVVVTRSPLVICTLDDDGEVQLSPVPTASVIVPRLDLPDDPSASQGIQVSVVQLAALEGFIKSLVAPPSEQELEAAAEIVERWQPAAAGENDAESTEADS